MKQSASPDIRSIFAQAVGHHQAGRLDEAVACYRQLLMLKPDFAPAHSNLGTALCEQGKLEEGEASYRHALAFQPDLAGAHNNLGTVLYERERLEEAAACYRRALALEPDYAEALNNLGAVLHAQGKLDQAEAGTRRALAAAPGFPRALENLGAILKEQARLGEAADVYRELLRIEPANTDAWNGLAEVQAEAGDGAAALTTIRQSLRIGDTERARRIFAGIVKPLRWTKDDGETRTHLTRALTEAWARPGELARTAASLIKQNIESGPCIARAAKAWPRSLPAGELFGADGPEALAEDELLLSLLVSAQNADIELEYFLTLARRSLLEAADGCDEASGLALKFHAALARQCFINEYVFFQGEEEIRKARDLRDALVQALDAGGMVSPLRLLAVAAYFPLHSVPGALRLLDRPWPDEVTAVLMQQVREPEDEAQLRARIPRLTPIEDKISRKVQTQYEENPYPRWVRIPRAEKTSTVSGYLRRKFPLAPFAPQSGEVAEILSAGCGTGQLTLEIAQSLKACVLAVDLSLNSLGYAARKARELGLDAIAFAQADLQALAATGRRFDVVECSGVLHHLSDLFAGWQSLSSLLKPGGFMVLGLYSEAARRHLAEARASIARRGYGASGDDIRRCRQDLLRSDMAPDLLASDDFFGVGSCRDLLFHVQELRTDLSAIAAFLERNGLTFLGFEIGDDVLQAYRRRFPGDPGAIDLGNWNAFEHDHPHTFSGMYRFWVQKGSGEGL